MSAEVLREAARDLREDHPPCKCGRMDCPTLFFEAVAHLLENEASLIVAVAERPDLHMPLNGARTDRLLAVARAYLGSDQ